jgi:hypothetical protein
VSAWAGIHYFASRHGFHAPGDPTGSANDANPERDGILTWPEGNGWLTKQLARAARRAAAHRPGRHAHRRGARRRRGRCVGRGHARSLVRWQAERCIVALPVFIAARVVENPPEVLKNAAAHVRYAPWLVANMHLRGPLADRPGAAPSWDNVIYGTRGLGYVDARHQALDPTPRGTVLSWYRPLGPSGYDTADGRKLLLERPWTGWRDDLLAELSVPHPDLPSLATRIDITRYGHAMSIPTAGPARADRPAAHRAGRRAPRQRRRGPAVVRARGLVGLLDLRGGVHARARGRDGGWHEDAGARRLRQLRRAHLPRAGRRPRTSNCWWRGAMRERATAFADRSTAATRAAFASTRRRPPSPTRCASWAPSS